MKKLWLLACMLLSLQYLPIPVQANQGKYATLKEGIGLNVRTRPSNSSPILVTVTKEEQLYIMEDINSDWIKVSTFDDFEGYVRKDIIVMKSNGESNLVATQSFSKTSNEDKADELISMAEIYIGTPYVWGGNSLTKGVDCSGYTKALYAKLGINLPRTAHLQSKVGESLNRSQLQKGDLIFFGSDSHITHVAIYIENDTFIHSGSSDGGVCKGTLNSDYYSRNFHHGVRLL